MMSRFITVKPLVENCHQKSWGKSICVDIPSEQAPNGKMDPDERFRRFVRGIVSVRKAAAGKRIRKAPEKISRKKDK